MKLGKAVKMARAQQGLKQAELAERLEVSANYISLLENDKRDPSWSFVCRLAKVLQVPLPLLLLLASGTGEAGGLGPDKQLIAMKLLSIISTEREDPKHHG